MPNFNGLYLELGESLEIVHTKKELEEFFNSKLVDLDYDNSVRKYVAGLMADFAYDRGNHLISVIYGEALERARIKELFERKAFFPLKDIGDVFLWFCGFSPEHVIDKNRNRPRFMLTLDDYMGYGRDAYFKASLLNKREFPIREISDNFAWVAHSIINMRDRINPKMKYSMHPETIREIERVINDGEPIFEIKEEGLIVGMN
jgi:hypothetical protein